MPSPLPPPGSWPLQVRQLGGLTGQPLNVPFARDTPCPRWAQEWRHSAAGLLLLSTFRTPGRAWRRCSGYKVQVSLAREVQEAKGHGGQRGPPRKELHWKREVSSWERLRLSLSGGARRILLGPPGLGGTSAGYVLHPTPTTLHSSSLTVFVARFLVAESSTPAGD